MSVRFTVLGQVTSMKNRRRILKNQTTGKRFSAKSDEAVQYISDFALQVPPEFKKLRLGSLAVSIGVRLKVWYRSRRSDLETAIIYDALETAGVLSNDRVVTEQHHFGMVDAVNPRVEIELWTITDESGLT